MNHLAKTLEVRVCESVYALMEYRSSFAGTQRRMIELEGKSFQGNPDLQMEVRHEKLAEAGRMRSCFQDLATEGLMTHEELGSEALRRKKERVERLEQDKETPLESHPKRTPEVLGALSAEKRHQLYRMLRLRVVANSDKSIEVTWDLVPGFTPTETVLR